MRFNPKPNELFKAFCSFACLLVVSLSLRKHFDLYADSLFIGQDGNYMLDLVSRNGIWGGTGLYFGSDILQGLGSNIVFPVNIDLEPVYLLASILGLSGRQDYYLLWSFLLGLSCFPMYRSMGFGARIALPSSLITVLFITCETQFKFYPITSIAPSVASLISLYALYSSLVFSDSPTKRYAIAKSFLTGIVALLLLYVFPAMAPLSILALLISLCMKRFCLAANGLLSKDFFLSAISTFVAISITGPFLTGLFMYTGFREYVGQYVFTRNNLEFASTLFYGYGIIVIPFSLAGLVVTRMRGGSNKKSRMYSGSSVIVLILLVILGAFSVLRSDSWVYPSVIYLEWYFWPLYGLGICLSIAYFSKLLFAKIRLLPASSTDKAIFIDNPNTDIKQLSWPVSAILAFTIVLEYSNRLIGRNLIPYSQVLPVPSKPRNVSPGILKVLTDNLSIGPGDLYKGRFANLIGMSKSGSMDWLSQSVLDNQTFLKYGNTYRFDLWRLNIPTLAEYNSFLTPRYQRLLNASVILKRDRQSRSVLITRKVDTKILRSIGVRYILTDAPLPDAGLELKLSQRVEEDSGIYLYELMGSNLSGVSATQLNYSPLRRSGVRLPVKIIQGLGNNRFYTTRMPLADSSFVPTDKSRISALRGGIRLRASSAGLSALILPFEFTNCYFPKLNNPGAGGFVPVIFEANNSLLGIIYEKDVDIDLYYKLGLESSWCRIMDYFSF